jgi:hypothetical protein
MNDPIQSVELPWSRTIVIVYLINVVAFWVIGWSRIAAGAPRAAGAVWFIGSFGWLVHYFLLRRRPYIVVSSDHLSISRGPLLERRIVNIREIVEVVLRDRGSTVFKLRNGQQSRISLGLVSRSSRIFAREALEDIARKVESGEESHEAVLHEVQGGLVNRIEAHLRSIAGVQDVEVLPNRREQGATWPQDCGRGGHDEEEFAVLVRIVGNGILEMTSIDVESLGHPRSIVLSRIGAFRPVLAKVGRLGGMLGLALDRPPKLPIIGLDVGPSGEWSTLGGRGCRTLAEVVSRYEEILGVVSQWPRCPDCASAGGAGDAVEYCVEEATVE